MGYQSLRGAADIPGSGRGPNRQSRHLSRGSCALEVFDLRGRLVWQGDALWNGTRWELPRLGAGAWVLRARTERGIVAQRAATFRRVASITTADRALRVWS